ncbi:hypothetical protein BH23GEM10_BH23GEM10_10620 [soil metagenome]
MSVQRPPDPDRSAQAADGPNAPAPGPNARASSDNVSVPGANVSVPSGRAVSRPAFREVIRRAAELSLSDADADDDLTEDEVIRIATELGLPEHHVQRALFELPELSVQPRWSDRHYGSPVFSVTRVIPSDASMTLRRIEDYLITREYLQLVRRRGETLAFVPADDTISSLARAVFRSNSRHIVARASRVVVGSHAMPEKGTHVRFDVDLSDSRRELLRTGVTLGALGGLLTGSVAAGITAGIMPGDVSMIPHVLAFAGGFGSITYAGFAAGAKRFQHRVHAAKYELVSLLDRLEHGERLDPPPAPWRRKLQLRLFGDRSR